MDQICTRRPNSHALGGTTRDRDCDHFYLDEEDPARKASGQRIELNVHLPSTFVENLSNPLAAQEQRNLKPALTRNELTRMGYARDYFIFVPKGTALAAQNATAAGKHHRIHLSLLFCVGDQMNRAGLRRFFADRTDAALITIPGVEASAVSGITTPWGIGIDSAQIDQLLESAGLDVDYTIDVLAAYSTGYHGMQATIRESTVALDQVKQIVYYDCLYTADQYKAGAQTADVIAAFRRVNSTARIVVYEVTDGGTKRYSGNLAIKDPQLLLINLKNQSTIPPVPKARYLSALIHARLLDEGLHDNLFTRSDIPPNFNTLRSTLMDRGELASTPTAIPSGPPKPPARTPILLEKWGSDNSKTIDAVQSELPAADHLIFKFVLMGWNPDFESKISAEAQHDQFLPELAWEFLPPPP